MFRGSKSEPETLNEADGMFVSGRRKGSAEKTKSGRDVRYGWAVVETQNKKLKRNKYYE